jgi:hypothetical protein
VLTRSTWGYLSGVADLIELEFWPEYDSGPLWAQGATSVDLFSLPLSEGLRARLVAWNDRYDDSKLPFDNNDTVWLDESKVLLRELRHERGDAQRGVVGRGAQRIAGITSPPPQSPRRPNDAPAGVAAFGAEDSRRSLTGRGRLIPADIGRDCASRVGASPSIAVAAPSGQSGQFKPR